MRNHAKRFLALALAGLLTLGSLVGCSTPDGGKETTKAQEQTKGSEGTEGQDNTTTEAATTGKPTEPITISILTSRHSGATNNAEDIWFFKYLEYWLGEQGYDVTLDVQQTMEPDQQLSLMLGTDSLPDLIWGIDLTPNNAVIYGTEEKMLLDWTPYINEQYMPNLYAGFQEDPDALAASTCLDGAVYSIPSLSARSYYGTNCGFGMLDRWFINEDWLKQVNMPSPDTLDELLDVLRAFKENIKSEDGSAIVPVTSNADLWEKGLWMRLGYYGDSTTQGSKYGTVISIKDGKIALPAYSDDYKTFIEIMKTCYDEGLISPDHFTMDSTTVRGISKAGLSGIHCDWTLDHIPDFTEWGCVVPFAIGDTEEVAISMSATYTTGKIWASADTKYPEVVALIVDYIYGAEGALMYEYGPQEGKDPLKLVDGWQMTAEGNFTTKLVLDGTYDNMTAYTRQYIHAIEGVGKFALGRAYAKELCGIKVNVGEDSVIDVITGETITGSLDKIYDEITNKGDNWRVENTEASEKHVTTVLLPQVYMTEEDALRATEIQTVLNTHIITESAKFITGVRPMSEINKFMDELKAMEVEEYIALYEKAYSSYMEGYFGK